MEINPYLKPLIPADDESIQEYIKVTWKLAAKVWWSYVWRGLLFSVLFSLVAGGIIGLIFGVVGVPVQRLGVALYCVGIPIGVLVGISVMRNILQKSWSDFLIVLLPVNR